jgi:AbrB family looped-hinge helix DNA binding protein
MAVDQPHGTSRMDNRGRIVIPKDIREKHGFEENDFFLVVDEGDQLVLHQASPFDVLAEHAEQEAREGNTIPLDELDEN